MAAWPIVAHHTRSMASILTTSLSPLLIAAAIATKLEPSPPAVFGLNSIISIENYSTLYKLLAATEYVFHFIGNLRMQSAEQRQVGSLEAEESYRAKMNWIRTTQLYVQEGDWQFTTNPKAS